MNNFKTHDYKKGLMPVDSTTMVEAFFDDGNSTIGKARQASSYTWTDCSDGGRNILAYRVTKECKKGSFLNSPKCNEPLELSVKP